MATDAIDVQKLKALATLSADELGTTEEDVKIHFVVPLLHALGHSRLRFEHKGMDIVLKTGLPRGCTVVVETKRPDVSLDAHLAQLERYSFEERSLLSLLTNGRRLRIYAPFWNRAKSFAETLLWDFARGDLAQGRHTDALAAVLSHHALATRAARTALEQRQATVEFIWDFADEVRQSHREWRERLEARLGEIAEQMAELEAESRRRHKELGKVGPTERDKIRRLFKLAGLPLVPSAELADAATGPQPGPPTTRPARARPRDWTHKELFTNATTYQRQIFATFVAAGQRTLGTKEIESATGLKASAITAAMCHFRIEKQRPDDAEPLIAFRKTSANELGTRGNLLTIATRYWPTVQRLYAEQAAEQNKTRKPRKKARRKRRTDK